jgi:hypothetical protein
MAKGLSPAAKKLADRLSAHKWTRVAEIVEQRQSAGAVSTRLRDRRVRRALSELNNVL